jgi:hypothetical protein
VTQDSKIDEIIAKINEAMKLMRELKGPLYSIEGGESALAELLCGPSVNIPWWTFTNTKFFAGRGHMLPTLPQAGIVAEIGTLAGNWARQILDLNKPEKLYTIDISYRKFQRERFIAELARGQLELREGLSWEKISEFSDGTFDWIYIDAAHDYDSVRRDAEAAFPKLKDNGYLVFNDFTVWSVLEFLPYGVARAAMQMVQEHNLEVTHFCFSMLGYHDIAMRRRL